MAGLFYAHDAQEEDVATRLRVSAEIARGAISIEGSLHNDDKQKWRSYEIR